MGDWCNGLVANAYDDEDSRFLAEQGYDFIAWDLYYDSLNENRQENVD